MDLDELLAQVRDRRLMLQQNGRLWAPNTHVPAVTRSAIKQHRAELLHLIAESDIRTCASPSWHRRYWKHAGGGKYRCEVCQSIVFT